MEFNLNKAPISKALAFQKTFPPKLMRSLRILLLLLAIISLGAWALGQKFSIWGTDISLLTPDYLFLALKTWLGLTLIFLPLGLWLLVFEIFFHSYLKYPKIKSEENVAELLDFDSAVVLNRALSISKHRDENEVSTDSLFLALVEYRPAAGFFTRIGLPPTELEKQLEKSFHLNFLSLKPIPFLPTSGTLSPQLRVLLADADEVRREHQRERITIMDLIVASFDANAVLKHLVIQQNLDKNDLSTLASWYERYTAFFESRRKFWQLNNLLRATPIGATWVYGYPLLLTRFTHDLTLSFRKEGYDMNLVDRQNETTEIQRILAQRDEANILLVGEKGIGKRTIVLKLAQRISEGKTLSKLNYKRVLQLNVPAITSSSQHPSDVYNTLTLVLDEAVKVGNIILFIPGFHNFVGTLTGLGRTDISAILLPYLESSNIQIIATTNPTGLHKHIETQSGILNEFSKVEVKELGIHHVMQIIEDLTLAAEARSKLFFTYGAMKAIVEDADKYVQIVPFPEKAVDLFNEVTSYVESKQRAIIWEQDVHDVVSQKTHIPLGKITGEEREKLLALEQHMHREIIGQEQAVTAVVHTMQRLRSGLTRRGKPAGVFLFVGPTGVGKTLTAKILAKTYFGSPETMIRFDMSEYQNKESLDRLLGSLPLNEPGRLATQVRDNPFSVLLLDEIEKAHKDILNIFLQVFDEGRVTDAFGGKVSFEQNIIIATSNAGSEQIRDMVRQGVDPAEQKSKIIDILINQGYFRPELLNRFDEIVTFHPLSHEHIRKIAELLVGGLVDRLREQGYFFIPTKDIVDYISDVGFDPQFGARPMNRAIQDKFENVIAKKILEEKIHKGMEFTLTLQEVQ